MKDKIKKYLDQSAERKTSNQSLFYILIGGYLLYITYNLINASGDSSMPLWLTVLAVIVFVIFGLGTILFGIYNYWYHSNKTKSEEESERTEEEAEMHNEERENNEEVFEDMRESDS